ncbi:MAG: glycosyltransferase family 2 protein [Ginsengibacter sp.]
MNGQPLVSVLMTAYNRQQFIAEAIESVLASTYTNFELIISDDCSTDGTVINAKKYAEKDNRIRLYQNEKNLGDYPNRNKAASYATGEFLMTVDSDDIIFKDAIERCMNLLSQFPQVNFATYYRIPAKEPFVSDPATALNHHFFIEPYLMIHPGGTIIKRNYFESINRFPEKYGPANDNYYNLKAACNTDILMIPFEFFYYRRHPGQQINDKYSYLYNNYRYTRDALNELNLPLKQDKITWLHKKNKRRFLVNIFLYLFKTLNFRKTINAIRYAEFTWKDALTGIFQF